MPRPAQQRRSTRRQQTIRDIWGNRWRVHERRPTPYGFAIYMGWPVDEAGGKAAIIVSAPLATHLRTHLQRPHWHPLPIGRKALRRVRRLLGLDHKAWIDARIDWWIERIDDLATLSAVRFAKRHRASAWTRRGTLSATLVYHMRVALLGRESGARA